ncbi:hypothetical protein HMPREF0653_01637 [Prevotella disiens JCM 6334 = ATCC 29426]|uniref:Uncharacterized protein n=1 Tax=Prevotella disiens JCM 6334 = ATCC 29426 TaxID=1235811 RepID=A0ABN0NR91_9BACT|nr:hypothetical protein HMPREF0653_01637 [Prevotella disiens JCM 6334 = ATCC 29426]
MLSKTSLAKIIQCLLNYLRQLIFIHFSRFYRKKHSIFFD